MEKVILHSQVFRHLFLTVFIIHYRLPSRSIVPAKPKRTRHILFPLISSFNLCTYIQSYTATQAEFRYLDYRSFQR